MCIRFDFTWFHITQTLSDRTQCIWNAELFEKMVEKFQLMAFVVQKQLPVPAC